MRSHRSPTLRRDRRRSWPRTKRPDTRVPTRPDIRARATPVRASSPRLVVLPTGELGFYPFRLVSTATRSSMKACNFCDRTPVETPGDWRKAAEAWASRARPSGSRTPRSVSPFVNICCRVFLYLSSKARKLSKLIWMHFHLIFSLLALMVFISYLSMITCPWWASKGSNFWNFNTLGSLQLDLVLLNCSLFYKESIAELCCLYRVEYWTFWWCPLLFW